MGKAALSNYMPCRHTALANHLLVRYEYNTRSADMEWQRSFVFGLLFLLLVSMLSHNQMQCTHARQRDRWLTHVVFLFMF